MANIDYLVTLAGQFTKPGIGPRQQKFVEIMGKAFPALGTGTKPTVAQWNTLMASSTQFLSPNLRRDLDATRAALWWQYAVTNVSTGVAVANQTTNLIVNAASYLQGLDDKSLECLDVYLTGKALSVLS